MTRRQIGLLVLANALISLILTLGVIWASLRLGWLAPPSQPTPYVLVPSTPAPLATVALATRTPTPLPGSPSPTIATEEYVVQPGDTLLGIAVRFGLDPETLLELNEIDNADRLFVGQRLRVPAGSVPTPTATTTPLPVTVSPTMTIEATFVLTGLLSTPAQATLIPLTATTAMPGASATLAPVAVSATLTVTPSGPTPTLVPGLPAVLMVIAPGDLEREAIVLVNLGQVPLQMLNWSLSRPDGRRYVFPRFLLAPGAEVRVHTGAGQDSRTDLYWSQPGAAWGNAQAVILSNQAGQEVVRYTIRSSGG